ncbi:MAG: hypothetical protein WBO55_10085, partial [Rhizobiaceae bacterium]
FVAAPSDVQWRLLSAPLSVAPKGLGPLCTSGGAAVRNWPDTDPEGSLYVAAFREAPRTRRTSTPGMAECHL